MNSKLSPVHAGRRVAIDFYPLPHLRQDFMPDSIAESQSPVITRPILVKLLFAFLLLSQQLGITHAISHLGAETASSNYKKQLPTETQCLQCLAFASIGSGLPSSPSTLSALAVPPDTDVRTCADKPLPSALRAFNPRAPPVLPPTLYS
jgi:hypothetical protein